MIGGVGPMGNMGPVGRVGWAGGWRQGGREAGRQESEVGGAASAATASCGVCVREAGGERRWWGADGGL
eukprot:1569592-Rhodomonas_salina.1